MKTNKERVEEVFRRAEAYNASASEEKVTEKKSSQVKPWVKWVACTLSAVILVGAIIGLVVGLIISNRIPSLDKMYIADFEKYTAIGGGTENTSASTVGAYGFKSFAVNNNESYLIGVDRDGNVERLKFTKDKNHNSQKQDYKGHLYNIYSLKNFTFVSFIYFDYPTKLYGEDCFPNYNNAGSDTTAYIIDNRTGKIYSLEVLKNDNVGCKITLNFSNVPSDIDGKFLQESVEGEDCVYFKVEADSVTPILYRAYVENEELVIEKAFDFSSNLIGLSTNYFADRFGNVYLLSNDQHREESVEHRIFNISYMIDRNDEIKPVSKDCFLSENGVVYTDILYHQDSLSLLAGNAIEGAKTKFDAAGNMVENDFNGFNYSFNSSQKIKSVDNVDYYYAKNETSNYIYKVTWEDDVHFSCEKTLIEDVPEEYVFTKDYIYFCASNKIFKVDVLTGEREAVNSEYIFSSIKTDYLGNVIFTAIDSHQNNVVGIIDNDGNISIEITARKYEIYYIKTLN